MQSWECNLGVVSHWDTDLQCYEVRVLKICYNADEELPVKMIIESPSGELFAVSSSKELVVVANGDPLNVTINDELFILVDEQKAKLLSVGGKWSYNDGEIREVSLFDAIPGKYAKDFGLIYVNLDGSYTMANLIVDFDWNSSMPIILFIKTYDNSMLPQTLKKSRYTSFSRSVERVESNLLHCSVCGIPMILTKEQSDYMDTVQMLLGG